MIASLLRLWNVLNEKDLQTKCLGSFTKVKKEDGGLADKATCNYCLRPFSRLSNKEQAQYEGT